MANPDETKDCSADDNYVKFVLGGDGAAQCSNVDDQQDVCTQIANSIKYRTCTGVGEKIMFL